jgi:hypothetical protein
MLESTWRKRMGIAAPVSGAAGARAPQRLSWRGTSVPGCQTSGRRRWVVVLLAGHHLKCGRSIAIP